MPGRQDLSNNLFEPAGKAPAVAQEGRKPDLGASAAAGLPRPNLKAQAPDAEGLAEFEGLLLDKPRVERPGLTVKNGMTLFFTDKAALSNWHKVNFEVGGVQFNCMEQYMMHSKAKLFGDDVTARQILAASHPKEQKALGRKVSGFSEEVWEARREPIMVTGYRAKYGQNPGLKEILLETEGTDLVEASPYDRVWGAGLAATDPRIFDRRNWTGLNLCGKVQQQVRDELLEERAESAPKPRTGGIDFKKLLEQHRMDKEHGPRLDAEWEADRAAGRLPTFKWETQDAVISGNTYPLKGEISSLEGAWKAARKVWVVPAFGAGNCDRKNFDFVRGRQERLDALEQAGLKVDYIPQGSFRP